MLKSQNSEQKYSLEECTFRLPKGVNPLDFGFDNSLNMYYLMFLKT
jgi:hypothetical protein